MHRSKLIRGLALLNVAVIIASITFLPRQFGYSFSYNSDFERLVKLIWHRVPWGQVAAIALISGLVTVGLLWVIDGLRNSPSGIDHDLERQRTAP